MGCVRDKHHSVVWGRGPGLFFPTLKTGQASNITTKIKCNITNE
jgi:hypothetical protein